MFGFGQKRAIELVPLPYVPQTRDVVRRVDITEHRAPTDESVALLRDMEAKAREQVEQALHVGDTTFDCVVHRQINQHDQTIHLVALFSMNGKRLKAEYRETLYRTNMTIAVQKLRDEVAQVIATHVLSTALQGLDQIRW
jgi:hypothetical protein